MFTLRSICILLCLSFLLAGCGQGTRSVLPDEETGEAALTDNILNTPTLQSTSTPAPTEVIRIMPLGDSLTEGAYPEGHASYRGFLRAKLIRNGYTNIDFVGDRYLQAHGDIEPYDKEHAGHGGYTIGPDTYRWCKTCETTGVHEHIKGWLSVSKPDIILLLIGINDLFNPENHPEDYANTAPQRLKELVDHIQELSPEAKILVSSLLQVNWTDADKFEYRAINAAAQEIGNASHTDHVYFVDLNAIDLSDEDYFDGVHLGPKGAEKVADGWYRYLEPILGSKSAGEN